jgi:hypothetical protein
LTMRLIRQSERKRWQAPANGPGAPDNARSKRAGRRSGATVKVLRKVKSPFWGNPYFLGASFCAAEWAPAYPAYRGPMQRMPRKAALMRPPTKQKLRAAPPPQRWKKTVHTSTPCDTGTPPRPLALGVRGARLSGQLCEMVFRSTAVPP